MLDPSGYVIGWNAGAERITGYQAKEIMGQHLSRFYPDENVARGVPKQVIKNATVDGHFESEGWRIRKDGARFWAEESLTAVWDESGKLRGFSNVTRDITERRKVDEIRARFAAIVESSDDAIISKTLDGIITSWNAGAKKIFGYSAQEVVGKSLQMIFPPERMGEEKEILARIAQRESIEHFETVRIKKDGTHVDVSATISPIMDSEGKVIGASKIARDITDRKRAEEEIKKLNQELEERVKRRTAQLEEANKELESFSYSVSHDLRAPLRHINGFAGLLASRTEGKLDSEAQRYLTTISDAAKRMGKLIDDLLVFSRLSRTELRKAPVNLADAVRDVRQSLEVDLNGRRVMWDIGALPRVMGDSSMIHQVIENLLNNAVKYTQKQLEAHIEVGSKTDRNGDTVVFVRDNGAGFDMRYADKLFGVFQRLHSSSEFEGTGVGLANVHRIIQRHGGRIWAEAKVNEGATFYFVLPLAPPVVQLRQA